MSSHSHDHGHGNGHGHDAHAHHGPTTFWQKYVFSTDHKVIGIQFFFSSLLFVVLGASLALGVRYQIAWPQQDVPYAAILPGTGSDKGNPNGPKMTIVAPEANLGHWKTGHKVEITESFVQYDGRWVTFEQLKEAVASKEKLEDEAKLEARIKQVLAEAKQFPARTRGELTGFPQGLAVTLPAQTKISAEGGTRTLTEPLPAFVDPLSVMADYNDREQKVVAVEGVVVRQQDDAGKPGTQRTIMGQAVYRPGITTGADTEKTVKLPTRREATLVTVRIPEQTVTVSDPEQLDGFKASPELRKKVADALKVIATSNEGIRKQRDAAIEPLTAKLAEAVKSQGEGSAAARLIQRQIDQKGREYDRQLKKEEVPVTVAAAGEVALPAMKINYEKNALTSDGYSQLFTMHASIMIFFVIIPSLVGGFGNFLIPLMIGARDMAFPKLNMLSFWLSAPAGVMMLASFWIMGGSAGGGWTMYPTLSTAEFSSNLGTTIWLLSVFFVGFSSIVGSLNYITTTVNMRAPGMSMFRMPLTVWSIFITSILQVFATPMLAAAAILLILDRTMGTTFFDPTGGGQPLLWQHLFWFYSHPAVYIMILPAMGVTSDILAVYARKPIFGYKPMVYAMAGITGLGFIVWGHHMFQSGMNPIAGTTFMASTIMIAVPSAIKTFNWLGTLWGGNIRYTPAMLNALAFVSMFVIGGLSGIFMASAPVDIHIHDTYFIVAHIHYVLFGGSIFGIFAGLYHWYPKMFGRDMNHKWGVIHFVMTIIAFNGTFFLMHILGIGGHPRRYATQLYYPTLEHLQPMNVFMTISAVMLGAAQLPFFYNFFVSLPRSLGRAMTATFIIALGLPMVVGLSYWGVSTGAWWASDPQFGYTSGQAFLGNLALWLAVLLIGGHMLLTLPRGGQVTVFIFLLAFLGVKVGAHHAVPGGALVDIISDAIDGQRLSIALGFGFIFLVSVIALVHVIWAVGGALHLPALLQRVLYVVFLPVFLAPLLLKQDPYIWINQPRLFGARWVLLCILGGLGALYLVIYRPKDVFGAATTDNPCEANSLEWATTSPPPFHNFDEIPTVYRGAYEYSSPVVEEDYLPQTRELPPGVIEPAAH